MATSNSIVSTDLTAIPNEPGYFFDSSGSVWRIRSPRSSCGDVPVKTKMVYLECASCHIMFRTKYVTARFCSKSCARYKHGGFGTKLHKVWLSMKTRCSSTASYEPSRRLYYDRGIRVCDAWIDSFVAFRDWSLSNGYTVGLCIDRIDGNGPYSPDNCRWITQAQNVRNRRITADMNSSSTSSRFKGVRRNGRNWSASICFDYNTQYLGTFNTEEEAAAAYNVAAVELFGDFACLNVIFK